MNFTEHKTFDALRVISQTPHIRAYLEVHDKMALKQVEEAIKDVLGNELLTSTERLRDPEEGESYYYIEVEMPDWAGSKIYGAYGPATDEQIAKTVKDFRDDPHWQKVARNVYSFKIEF